MQKTNLVTGPIPGMSLTKEPGSRPWESPPKLVQLSEVVDFYTDKFTNPEFVDALLYAISKGAPLYETAKGLANISVMQGVHTIDAAVLVTPVIVEMMKTVAELNDVGYIIEQADKERMSVVDKRVAEEAVMEVRKTEESRVEEPAEEEMAPKGLMVKGGMR